MPVVLCAREQRSSDVGAARFAVGERADAGPVRSCDSWRVDLEQVRGAEEALLTSVVRRDPSRVMGLLHPDFVEIGRSGRRWTRDEIVAALSNEGEHASGVTDEWALVELAPGLALVTYVIHGTDRDSRHSSIWTSNDGRLQILFHQGTFVAAQ